MYGLLTGSPNPAGPPPPGPPELRLWPKLTPSRARSDGDKRTRPAFLTHTLSLPSLSSSFPLPLPSPVFYYLMVLGRRGHSEQPPVPGSHLLMMGSPQRHSHSDTTTTTNNNNNNNLNNNNNGGNNNTSRISRLLPLIQGMVEHGI